jgi:hypothetical protein
LILILEQFPLDILVVIFLRKPKTIHFQAIVDKIKVKLATWDDSLLSIMG